MTVMPAALWLPRRLRLHVGEVGAAALAAILLIWWLLPVYNMMLIALDPQGNTEFTGDLWPRAPTLKAFRGVLFQQYWYFGDFWHQLGNSFIIGDDDSIGYGVDQFAGQLRLGQDMDRSRRDDFYRGAAHLHSSGVLLGYSVLLAHAPLWADG